MTGRSTTLDNNSIFGAFDANEVASFNWPYELIGDIFVSLFVPDPGFLTSGK
jgi:hypothetical protein